MQLARVVGHIVATRKDANLHGTKLLVIQPIDSKGGSEGRTLVAVDSVRAGVGDAVMFVRGREASYPFHPVEVPTDASIIGVVDHWSIE